MSCNSGCQPSAGTALSCKDNTPGIKRAYIGCYDSSTTFSVDADDVITGVTSGSTYFVYDLPKGTASLNEVQNVDAANGAIEYVPTITLALNKMRPKLRKEIALLATGTQTIILETMNGDYIIIGKENGIDLSSTADSGITGVERNGYTLTFTGREATPSSFIEYAAFSANIDTTQI